MNTVVWTYTMAFSLLQLGTLDKELRHIYASSKFSVNKVDGIMR